MDCIDFDGKPIDWVPSSKKTISFQAMAEGRESMMGFTGVPEHRLALRLHIAPLPFKVGIRHGSTASAAPCRDRHGLESEVCCHHSAGALW